MIPQIPQKLLSTLAKGGVGAILVVLIWGYTSWRGENRLDYQYQLERAEARERAYLATIERQASELKALERGFFFLSASRRQSPLPEWSKVATGQYQWKNLAFDQELLAPNDINPDSVLFRSDEEIWTDRALAKKYRQNDLAVIRENRVIHYMEYFQEGDEVAAWHTWKFPIRDANGSVMGVGGIAVREKSIELLN